MRVTTSRGPICERLPCCEASYHLEMLDGLGEEDFVNDLLAFNLVA